MKTTSKSTCGKLVATSFVAFAICAAMFWTPCAMGETNLSSIPIASGMLTVDAPGDYVVDTDISCTSLEVTAQGSVTFVNPDDDTTNTIHVVSITCVANASAVFNCKVVFDSTYNVAAEGPVAFAGGATATAPGLISGAYGNVLSGDVTFTSNWVLPASAAYTVPSGSRVTGTDVSGGNGSSVLVEDGGVAKFASAKLAIEGLRITVHGELDIEGWCECNATGTNVIEPVFPSATFSTGTIRVGGFKRTGSHVVCGFNAGDIYVGGNGLYSESTTQPMFFWIYKSEPVFHAMADFSIRGYNGNCGVALYEFEAVTFNTHGHTVAWTAKVQSNGREKLLKDGDGVFIMQPAAVGNANSKLMPIEVRGGTFRQANNLITGPVTVRSGAALAIADGVTISNDTTLEAGTALEFGAGASMTGSVVWPDGVVYICAVESGTLIHSGVTEEIKGRLALTTDSAAGELSVVDGALVFTKSEQPLTYTWNGADGGLYSSPGNWLIDGVVATSAPHAQDIAVFAPTADSAVTVDGNCRVSELRLSGSGAVTFANPSAGISRTIHVASISNASGVATTFNCKVVFDSTYNVAADGPVAFAGGATATAPGVTSGAYGNVLSGDVTFTSNWDLPAGAAYIVPAGARVTGENVSGGNGSSILVEEGGAARFASAQLAIQGLRITVHGELDVEGCCECNATGTNVVEPVFPSATFSTGTIRAGGFKRTGSHVVCGFNAGDIYVGENGLYSESTTNPMFFWIYKSEPVFHAMADFSIRGYNGNCGVALFEIEAVTFNTHGHTVAWTAKVQSNGREKLVKDGDGVFIMQPVAVANANSRSMPVEVRGGTFRQANNLITGPVTVRSGGTFEVVDNLAAPNAVTLEAGSVLALGVGGSVSGSIATPASGCATVRPVVDFSAAAGWSKKVTLGVLAAGADVSALVLDAENVQMPPKGWQLGLARDGDNLILTVRKSGMMVFVK